MSPQPLRQFDEHDSGGGGSNPVGPVDLVEYGLLKDKVAGHHIFLHDNENGVIPKALEDIDTLLHGRTAIYTAIGVVSFLAGLATMVAAFLALRP